MTEKDLDELLAGRALHALSPEDAARLEQALAADPALRARAQRDEETAALLADATPEVAPPAAIRDQLLARIAGAAAPADVAPEQSADAPAEPAASAPAASEPAGPAGSQAGEAEPAASAPARPGRRRWFALAASVAVVAAVGLSALTIGRLLDRPDAVVALEQIAQADDGQVLEGELPGGGAIEMHWSHSVGEVVVLADEAPALDEGRQYELWLVRGDEPIPAGVFDGGADEPLLLDGELAPGDVVAVTIEQEGGSPTGVPTTEPIAVMPTD
ncbi:anti-sigma factor [Microbacterium barkeri]|uniref:anti-sigma factor n=1 Tax=Microbacterium barkeri TaxID=33917 RepID=UPI0024AEC442|nr:anti-sigma factor [Microbacterium barkeri]MDI6944470.1 anti-sigma factor [Microbacterium barkeri]